MKAIWTVIFVAGIFFAGYVLGTVQERRTWEAWSATHATVFDLTEQP